jgi:hypothetical protein
MLVHQVNRDAYVYAAGNNKRVQAGEFKLPRSGFDLAVTGTSQRKHMSQSSLMLPQ